MAGQKWLDASRFFTSEVNLSEEDRKRSTEQKLSFAQDLVRRLQRDGFVTIRGHGIDADALSDLFRAHKAFFDLPLEKKRQVLYSGGATPARGFTPSHQEKTFLLRPDISKAAPDATEAREQFTIGPPEDRYFPTPWFEDEDLADIYRVLYSFYSACREVGLKLVQAIEIGTGLRAGTLTDHYLPDASELTLNWYPAASREALLSPQLKRIWPHSDLGIISLLFQDGVGGLEFENRERPGSFVPVEPAVGTEMIINASDTLERWTNGVISAGVHRVTAPMAMRQDLAPTGDAKEYDAVPGRRSVVLLYRAKGDTLVGPLPDFVTPDVPAKFSNITALEYLQLKNKMTFGDARTSGSLHTPDV